MIEGNHTIHLGVQVPPTQYVSASYCSPERFAAYSYQIKETLDSGARRVLEIGMGNGVVTYLLRRAGVRVDTVDHDPALEPDHVASVLELPFEQGAYDAVICFQVLEHLPWDLFPTAVKEISRVAGNHVIVSVPHISRRIAISLEWPRFGKRSFAFELERNDPMGFDGEHYWEIGRGVTAKQVCRVCEEARLKVERSYRIPEFRYHHMFVLSK